MAATVGAHGCPSDALSAAAHLACKLQNARLTMRTAALLTFLGACSLAATGCTHTLESDRNTTPPSATARHTKSSVETAFERGRSHADRGEYATAERELAAALAGGYAPARVLPVLLDVCAASRRYQAAVDYATPYLQLHPGDFQLRYRVASLLLELGQYERARSELRSVLATAPNFAPAHYLLAVTLRDYFRDTQEAAAHFSAYHRLSTRGTNETRSGDRRSML